MERPSLLERLGDAGSRFGREPPRRRSLRLAIQLGLAALIFGFLVFAVVSQWDELRERDVRFEVVWLLPAIATFGLFYPLMGLGWDLVVRLLGFRLPPARAQMVWGQSLLARYVPGNVLYVVGRVVLAEREGVPRRIGLASMVYEIGLMFASGAMIGSYFFINHPDLEGEPWRWAVLAVVPLALAAFHPRVFGRAANRLLVRFGREPLPVVMPMRGVVAMLCFYGAGWLVVGIGISFVSRAVYPFPFSELGVVVSAQALAFCASVLSVVFPSGLGVRDGAFAWAVKVALPGGSFALGAALAIAARIVLTAVELAYVGVVTLLGRRRHHRRREVPGPAAGASGPGRITGPPQGSLAKHDDGVDS